MITEQDYEDALDTLWDLIFEFRNAPESELGGAQETVNMQLTEVTNLAWYLGKQTMSVAGSKINL